MADQVRVFVSHHHSEEEDAFTARLVADLEAAGADVWVDDQRITSDDFIKKINEGLAGRQWLVLVMTPAALRSAWVQAEVNAALHQVRSGRMLSVIPIVATVCDEGGIPPLWATLHRYDATIAYEPARDGLLRALGLSPSIPVQSVPFHSSESPAWHYRVPDVSEWLPSLGFRDVNVNGTPAIVPPLVSIPGGPFMMNVETRDGMVQQRVDVPTYYLAKYPVTVAEYALAIADGAIREKPRDPGARRLDRPDRRTSDWAVQSDFPEHPVIGVHLYAAQEYIAWLISTTGQRGWRLPSEAEWRKAASWNPRANTSSKFPWGDSFDRNRCSNGRGSIRSIGTYPARDPQQSGASVYGIEDMLGTVLQWTSTSAGTGGDDVCGHKLLGGSWAHEARDLSAYRSYHDSTASTVGFRLAFTPEAGS